MDHLILTQREEIVFQHEQLRSREEELVCKNEQLAGRDAEIERLRLLTAKLQRIQFGRKSEKLARQSVELDRATLADWVGGASRLLEPRVEALRRHVMAADKLHGDDTPVPVLAPGLGKTKTGRLWTYVRDDRPAGQPAPPAVWFAYTPDRKGEHPQTHWSKFTGTLQADGYAGYDQVYESGRIQEAGCWAHVRRKFHDLVMAHKSPVAQQALERIGALYAIEKEIRGRLPGERRAVRNERSRPLLESLKQWLEQTLVQLSRK